MYYEPRQVTGDTVEELRQFMQEELQRIAEVLNSEHEVIRMAVLHRPVERPREGMIAWPDGSDWNPASSGGGLHINIGSPVGWVKLIF